MAEDLDRKVAEALGWEIRDDWCWPEFGLFHNHKTGGLMRGSLAGDGTVMKEWSPSTSAGDAIAALEAFSTDFVVGMSTNRIAAQGEGNQPYRCRVAATESTLGVTAFAMSFCEAICKAILLATRAAP